MTAAAVRQLIHAREQEVDLAGQLERLHLPPDAESVEWNSTSTRQPLDSDDSDEVCSSQGFGSTSISSGSRFRVLKIGGCRIFADLDPDPGTQKNADSDPGIPMRIRIRNPGKST